MRVLTGACRRAPPRFRSLAEADRSGALPDAAISSARRPVIGDHAAGHGVSGTIIAVPECQPLADDEIWRVVLAGEEVGRLVRRCRQELGGKAWQLLQLDDMSDEQLDAYEASMDGQGQGGTASSF